MKFNDMNVGDQSIFCAQNYVWAGVTCEWPPHTINGLIFIDFFFSVTVTFIGSRIDKGKYVSYSSNLTC